MVYEGFWDLYCKKPATSDLTARKLDGWVNKVNLKVPTFRQPQAEPAAEEKDVAGTIQEENENEEAAEQEEKPLPADNDLPDPPPLRAIVRVRIPLQREEPKEDNGEEE